MDGPPIASWHTNDWGYTWVPWFMMLSGFILTYARLASRNPDQLTPVFSFVVARTRSIYPLYLAGLLSAALLSWYLGGENKAFSLGSPGETLASLLLVQSWFPTVTEHVLQAHCWFLSCIVPYWLVHNATYRFMKSRPTKLLQVLLVGIWVAVWLLIVVIPWMAGDLYWYKSHSWGATDSWVDILVVMLKFHPICYFHIYVFGMALAVLHTRNEVHGFLIRNGAILGFGGLYLIFFTRHKM